MAGPYNPPYNGEEFITYITLSDMASPGSFKSNPTIASGDFKVSKDGGSLTNLSTTPTVEPSSSVLVKLTLSGTEMTADNVSIVGIDQTSTKEWADFALTIVTLTPPP